MGREFYDRDTIGVAQELLGKHLVHVVDGVPRVVHDARRFRWLGAL